MKITLLVISPRDVWVEELWCRPFSLIPFLQCTGTLYVFLQCVLVNVILDSIKPFKNEMITTATHNSIDRVINVVLPIY